MTQEIVNQYIKELIHDVEKDLVNMKIQEWIYQKEAAYPKHITKAKAMESLGIYQTRIKGLEQHLEIYQEYLKEHEF